MNDLISGMVPTMTSLEISELTGSRHDSVKRAIDRCVESTAIVQPPMVDEQSADTLGRLRVTQVFRLDRRSSIIVVAQLCPEFTAKIVDRWQELESRSQLSPATQAIVDTLVRQDALDKAQKALEAVQLKQTVELAIANDRLTRVEIKLDAQDPQYYSVKAYAAMTKVSVSHETALKFGKMAAKLSRAQGVEIGKVKDSQYGEINAYHTEILKQVFPLALT